MIRPQAAVKEASFYFLLLLFSTVMVLPLVWAISTSLKPDADIFSSPIRWIPTRFTLDHFRQVFTTVPFARYFANSLFLAGAGVVTNLFLGSLAGYAFARLRFRGQKWLFRLLLASMMVPSVVTIVPSFLILHNLPLAGGNDLLGQGGFGLLNSYWAVILPGAAGAFAVFLMRQFFLYLPTDIADAARLDGAGEFRIFWQMYLPLCKPALATLAVFTFQAGWNSFLWPLIVLNDPSLSTVQQGLAAFSYNHNTDFGPLMAGSIIAMLPMLLLFVYAQKHFANQGLAFTGID
jgi:multiple sugar transport system permease protein